jgi:hypothetical protein
VIDGWETDMVDLGSFATGVLTGFGASALLLALLRRFLEEGISNWFKVVQEQRKIVGKAEIEYRRQQLAELYGPLYAYLKAGELVYNLWMAGKLRDINDPIKRIFREQNDAMLNLVRMKTHLIDEGTFPQELALFMSSLTIWNLYTSQQDGIPPEVAQLEEVRFPTSFRNYVFDKTEKLKAELEHLYRKYEIK